MTKLFIWWHRRRAAYHGAMAVHPTSVFYREYNWHREWAAWHLAQIQRLQARVNPFMPIAQQAS